MTNVDRYPINEGHKTDITLDIDMAYLDLDEKELDSVQAESSSFLTTVEPVPNYVRRSTRKKIRPLDCENRRTTKKPKKVSDNNYKETVSYYLDKRVKKFSSSLETIFEEPKNGTFMASKRLKRFINFSETGIPHKDKVKIKKRALKAKKVHSIKRLNKKVSMDLLMKKLMSIE